MKDLDRLEQNDVRRGLPRFQGENLQQNVALVKRLEEMAAREGMHGAAARARLAAREGRRHRPDSRARNAAEYLEANAAAVDIALDPEEVAALDEAFPVGSAAGERYPPASMTLLETEQARSDARVSSSKTNTRSPAPSRKGSKAKDTTWSSTAPAKPRSSG